MDTTTSSLSGLMAIFYSKDFLDRANQIKMYDIGAQKRAMPKNGGKTVYFNRFTQLAAATTPLTESTNPSATALSTTVVSATVAEYGAYGAVSSLYEMTTIDEGLRESVAVFAEQGALTVDTLIKDVLKAGATAQLGGSKANITAIGTSDVLSGAEIRKAVKTLKKNGAHRFDDGFFKGIVPVSAAYDLMGNSEWLDAHRYTDATAIKNGEIGRLHGVTFYETNSEVTDSSTTTVYSTFIFGKNAYGVIDIGAGSNVEIIAKKSGSGDTSNPLNMFSTIGWKINAFVAKVLNANWIIKVQTGTQG
jgi:N4-gp56 family major capsid protein